MLHLTSSEDTYGFDFIFPTPDDELRGRLTRTPRPR